MTSSVRRPSEDGPTAVQAMASLPGQAGGTHSVLDRTFRLLCVFTLDQPELTLGELTALTGIPRTTVYRLAGELVSRRVLDHSNGRYRLGPQLFELGERVPRLRSVRNRIRPFLRELRERTDCTVVLGVLDRDEVLYLLEAAISRSPSTALRDGQRIPVHCTAIGKVLLAYSGRPTIDRIAATGLPRYTRATIVGAGLLRSELGRIRSQGYGTEYEEFRYGYASVAAPVTDAEGNVTAAIALENELARGDPGRFAPLLRAVATRVSIRALTPGES